MANSIHISQARKMLNSRQPVDIRLWTSKGEIQFWSNCISLKYDFYKGIRRVRLLNSREVRTVRDVCIFEINNLNIYI